MRARPRRVEDCSARAHPRRVAVCLARARQPRRLHSVDSELHSPHQVRSAPLRRQVEGCSALQLQRLPRAEACLVRRRAPRAEACLERLLPLRAAGCLELLLPPQAVDCLALPSQRAVDCLAHRHQAPVVDYSVQLRRGCNPRAVSSAPLHPPAVVCSVDPYRERHLPRDCSVGHRVLGRYLRFNQTPAHSLFLERSRHRR